MTDPDSISAEELRAAETAGVIPSGAARALLTFAGRRRGAQGRAVDEPLPLFRGVNDLLMALGVLVGGGGMLALLGTMEDGLPKALVALAMAAPVAWVSLLLARRRAELPGILAAIGGAALLGNAGAQIMLSWYADPVQQPILNLSEGTPKADRAHRQLADLCFAVSMPFGALIWGLSARRLLRTAFPPALAALGAAGWLVMLGVIALSGGIWQILGRGWHDLDNPDRMLATAILLVGGLITAALALRRDMSDPLRISYRATEAYWLHAAAALLLAGAISLGLIGWLGDARGLPIAAALGLPLSLYALIIDRRSFLTLAAAWVGWYAVRLARDLDLGSDAAMAATATLFLGLLLLGLALTWAPIRRALMRALPDFPGKDRLPPWDAASAARH